MAGTFAITSTTGRTFVITSTTGRTFVITSAAATASATATANSTDADDIFDRDSDRDRDSNHIAPLGTGNSHTPPQPTRSRRGSPVRSSLAPPVNCRSKLRHGPTHFVAVRLRRSAVTGASLPHNSRDPRAPGALTRGSRCARREISSRELRRRWPDNVPRRRVFLVSGTSLIRASEPYSRVWYSTV